MTYKQEAWDLSDIASEKSRKWGEVQLAKMQKMADAIAAKKKEFVSSISTEEFGSFMKLFEELTELEETIGEFAYLWWSENTKDHDSTAFKAAVERASTEIGNKLLFFSLAFVRFESKDIDRLIKAFPQYGYMLHKLANKKDHLLPEDQEKLINLKDVHGVGKLHTVYNMISAGMMFEFEGKRVTKSELVQNVHSNDPAKREKAYKTLFAKYREHEAVLGEIYQGIILDWQTENVDLRNYASSISVRNVANDIDDKDIDTLLRVAEKNQKVFWRYFALKAKMLGEKKLSRYHLYAPIKKPEKKIPYADGCNLVLDTFSEFSTRFHDLAKRMLDKKHIHSALGEGKNQGGYCYGTSPSIDPYILINYTDDAESVSTLAHELGHAIHFMLASEKQNVFHAHSALPVAETASIFCETVLVEKMKEKFPDLYVSQAFDQLDRIYASIGRQLEFVLFEKAAHAAALKGASTKELKDLYISRLRKHFGPNVEVPDDFANEWNYIPHIHNTPFYCYAYGFGNLLSLAVYAKYRELGPSFVDKIIEMLAGGGSMKPHDLVSILGFDIADESFWQSGFDIISGFIDQLEKHVA